MIVDIGYSKYKNKIHIFIEKINKPLCGKVPNMLSMSASCELSQFINQKDSDNLVCKVCRKKALTELKKIKI